MLIYQDKQEKEYTNLYAKFDGNKQILIVYATGSQ
jgi:hypothetical protein